MDGQSPRVAESDMFLYNLVIMIGCVEIGGNRVVMLCLCMVGMVGGVDGGLSLVHPGHTASLYF